MLLRILLLTLLSVACGRYSEVNVRDYKIHFATVEPELTQAAEDLIVEFNTKAGMPVFTLERDREQANSYVSFNKGLNLREKKIGYGQWMTQVRQEPSMRILEGRDLKRTVYWGMNIEFDYTYFRDRAIKPKDSIKWKTLFLLFCHEAGHGFKLDDTYEASEKSNVMHGEIAEVDVAIKNFDAYFNYVRDFVQDES
jgi:hypothetical protein